MLKNIQYQITIHQVSIQFVSTDCTRLFLSKSIICFLRLYRIFLLLRSVIKLSGGLSRKVNTLSNDSNTTEVVIFGCEIKSSSSTSGSLDFTIFIISSLVISSFP